MEWEWAGRPEGWMGGGVLIRVGRAMGSRLRDVELFEELAASTHAQEELAVIEGDDLRGGVGWRSRRRGDDGRHAVPRERRPAHRIVHFAPAPLVHQPLELAGLDERRWQPP